MNSASEMEMREQMAEMHFALDRMVRDAQRERHRARDRMNMLMVVQMAVIAAVFVAGALIGGSI